MVNYTYTDQLAAMKPYRNEQLHRNEQLCKNEFTTKLTDS